VNQAQPRYCAERCVRVLNDAGKATKGAKILLLGVSYKAGIGDMRESPALKIAAMLRDLGADVSYHDPHVPAVAELGLESVALEDGLDACDLAVIVTAHEEVDPETVVAKASRVLDLRGVTKGIEADHVVQL
jgi:UDP-N-acetyl-D-glucosamine dehydrogenase